MQNYSIASLVLVLMSVAVSAYGWPTGGEVAPQVSVLVNAKPVAVVVDNAIPEEIAPITPLQPTESETSVEIAAVEESADVADTIAADDITVAETIIDVPSTDGVVAAVEDIAGPASIDGLIFSTAIGQRYEAIGANNTFREGYYTLYATFAYDNMSEGTDWSWSWVRDGQVVGSGADTWTYGASGPGYVFLNPDEGFASGNYTLQIFVDDQMVSQSGFSISSNVANN